MLNAFRHHWNLHKKGRDRRRPAAPVLNAFRHHWNLHHPSTVASGWLRWCSTPFGIIGIFTSRMSSSARRLRCAQRLSASLESSRGWTDRRGPRRDCVLNAFRHHWNLHDLTGGTGEFIEGCSTPFGIIGIFTHPEPRQLHAAEVLNAFRHHWNLHARALAVRVTL